MPITINGSGTVTGITAGGLPDGVITTDDIAADAVTSAKIASGAIVNADVNASAAIDDSKLTGTTCKAWVNFNGTSTVAIRASYNVSSITDNGVGDFTVNFTNALTDANYAFALSTTSMGATAAPVIVLREIAAPFITSSLIRISTGNISSVTDPTYLSVAIFR
jgi:hypothetical protein